MLRYTATTTTTSFTPLLKCRHAHAQLTHGGSVLCCCLVVWLVPLDPLPPLAPDINAMVASQLNEASGVVNGLFDEEEMDSSNVKEKGAKLQFLEKLVRYVGWRMRTTPNARPGKIVAGMEAEYTNEVLQLLAQASLLGEADPDAVARARAGEDPVDADAGPAGPDPHLQEALRREEEQKAKARAEQAAAEAQRQAEAEARAAEQKRREQEAELEAARKRAEQEARRRAAEAEAQQSQAEAPVAMGGAGGGGGDLGGGDDEGMTAMPGPPKRSARPQTARRRPPRVKDGAQDGGANDAPAAVAVGVMKEGDSDSDDDIPEDTETAAIPFSNSAAPASGDAAAAAGKHTRDVLDQQRAAAAEAAAQKEESKEESPKQTGIKMGRIKKAGERGTYSQMELTQLRDAIQKLCQSTNPLGKSIVRGFDWGVETDLPAPPPR